MKLITDIYSIVLPIQQLQTPIEDDAKEFLVYITYQDAKDIIESLNKLMAESEKDAEQEQVENNPTGLIVK